MVQSGMSRPDPAALEFERFCSAVMHSPSAVELYLMWQDLTRPVPLPDPHDVASTAAKPSSSSRSQAAPPQETPNIKPTPEKAPPTPVLPSQAASIRSSVEDGPPKEQATTKPAFAFGDFSFGADELLSSSQLTTRSSSSASSLLGRVAEPEKTMTDAYGFFGYSDFVTTNTRAGSTASGLIAERTSLSASINRSRTRSSVTAADDSFHLLVEWSPQEAAKQSGGKSLTSSIGPSDVGPIVAPEDDKRAEDDDLTFFSFGDLNVQRSSLDDTGPFRGRSLSSSGSPASPGLPHVDSFEWGDFTQLGTRQTRPTHEATLTLEVPQQAVTTIANPVSTTQNGNGAAPSLAVLSFTFRVMSGAVHVNRVRSIACVDARGSVFVSCDGDFTAKVAAYVRTHSTYYHGGMQSSTGRMFSQVDLPSSHSSLFGSRFLPLAFPSAITIHSTLGHREAVLTCVCSPEPDCRYIATGSADGTLNVYDATMNNRKFNELRHPAAVTCAAFSQNAKFVVTGCTDGVCRLYHSRKKDVIATMNDHKDAAVTAIAFQCWGDRVLSGASDGSVRLWLAATQQTLFEFKHERPVLSVSFSFDGKLCLSGDINQVAIVDAHLGAIILTVHRSTFATTPKRRSAKSAVVSPASDTSLPRAPSHPTPKSSRRNHHHHHDDGYSKTPATSDAFIMAAMFAPMPLTNFIVVSLSDRETKLFEILHLGTVRQVAISPERLSVSTRDVVCALSVVPHTAVCCGDAQGNMYLLELTVPPTQGTAQTDRPATRAD